MFNYCMVALISHSSKVMLKILQTRLQPYVNRELPDVQARFRRGRGTRDQIFNIRSIFEKVREFQKKNIYFCFIDYTKAFDWFHHFMANRWGGRWGAFLTILSYDSLLKHSKNILFLKQTVTSDEKWILYNNMEWKRW